jgi:hypothetical protein
MWVNNAAAIGEIDKFNGRAIVSYRSQWDMDSPFRDIFAAYQYRFEGLSIGGKVIREDAGEASMARTKLIGDMAYQKELNYEGDMISAGASFGLLQNRIASGLLKFDSQYTEGQGFDFQMDSGELLSGADRIRLVFDAGFLYRKYFYNSDITIGLSVQNINSFVTSKAENRSFQPVQYTIYSRYKMEVYEGFRAEVFASYRKYSNLHLPMLMLRGHYKINEEYECFVGIGKRLHNTAIGQVGLKWRHVEVNLSIDIANAQLPVSASTIELGGVYQFKTD